MSDPWEMIVSLSGPSAIDADEVRRALGVLLDPQGHHELRGLPMPGSRRVESRIACGANLDAAVESVARIASGIGTYYTLNMVRADLGDRAAKVGDITSRRWILIDCDRSKAVEPDAMATRAEKAAAQELAGRVATYLTERGFPLPVVIDSGNGQHLLYLIDLPANEDTRVLVRGFLKALAEMFHAEGGPSVDAAMHNASRISKLPGTWVRKGQNTPERPWRMARLMFVPEPLEVVSRELIDAVAGIASTEERPSPPYNPDTDEPAAVQTPVPSSDSWEMIVQGGQDRITAYVKAAVDRETVKVLLAPEGKRNDFLNEAAFALGQFVGAHLLSRDDVVRDLTRAACGCGLDRDPGCGERGIAATIASGLDAGILQPRVIPAPKSAERNGKHEKATDLIQPGKKLIIFAKDIKPRKVEWLIPNRIPIGKMTTFAGQTGMGKTFAVCDLAARITTGEEIPCGKGECFQEGKVLIISAEDDADDTIVPRFMELGGDRSKLAFLTPEAEDHFSLAALELLNASLDQMNGDVRMVAIDPPTSYLGRVDDHKNAELRGLLAPLRRWSIARRVALIFITHVNKAASSIDAMSRVMGSAAWVQAVRAAHMFCPDPTNKSRSLWVPLKVNNSKKPPALAYQIRSTHDDLAVIDWLQEVDTTADEAMSQDRKQPKTVDACECLIEMFNRQREWPGDLFWAHLNQNGVKRDGYNAARVKLGLPRARRTVGTNGDVTYVFWVPPNWPHLADIQKFSRNGPT